MCNFWSLIFILFSSSSRPLFFYVSKLKQPSKSSSIKTSWIKTSHVSFLFYFSVSHLTTLVFTKELLLGTSKGIGTNLGKGLSPWQCLTLKKFYRICLKLWCINQVSIFLISYEPKRCYLTLHWKCYIKRNPIKFSFSIISSF